MDLAAHQKAKQLFETLCDLPQAAQNGRLRALTDDTEIIDFVEKLLLQADTDHPRVAHAVLRGLSTITVDEVKVGDTLGVWKLASAIGQGGMGSVFLAKRIDGHFEQTAAIKVLHGVPSTKALEHLARERQILAKLTHPNIARLYDGGATPNGQPYLVLEHVEGMGIDRYVRDNKLDKNAILNLLTAVCSAVSFAHQRLIVHCDIKPSNILVNEAGRPTLLDFGIARLLGAAGQPESESVADAQSIGSKTNSTKSNPFTPRYASPEQREGGALSTSTDVYSLGKLLQALLSDTAAAVEMTSIKTLEKSIDRASPTTIDSVNMDVELRAIIHHATASDPQKRYVTVAAMAADIAHYQHQQPLKALPHTPLYVAQKFSQRNWPWLLVASVFVVGIGAATLRVVAERDRAQAAEAIALQERDSTKQAQAATLRERDGAQAARAQAEAARMQAEAARDRAATAEGATAVQRDRANALAAQALVERNRAVQAEVAAKQTSQFLISVFENAGPTATTGDVTASALLDRAEKQLEADMKGQPQVQARLYSTLGTVQRGMGAYLKAERLHSKAVDTEKQRQAVSSSTSKTADTVAQRAALALAEKLFIQANDLYVNAKGNQAMTPALEALALREKHAAPDDIALGESLSQVGHMWVFARKLDEGKPLLQRGLAIIEKSDPQGVPMAYALGNMSWYLSKAGDFGAAEAMARRALDLRVLQGGSTEAPAAVKQRQDLARIIEGAGRIEEAQALFAQTLASRAALHGHDNIRVAIALRRLGHSLLKQDRALEALPKYIEAIEIVVKTEQKESPHYQTMSANLGTAYIHLGDYAAAAIALQQATEYVRKMAFLGWQDRLIIYLNQQGFASTRLGRFDEAATQLNEALAISLKADDEKTINTISTLVHLIDLATAKGDDTEAAKLQTQLQTQMQSHLLQKDQVLPPNLSAMLAQSKARQLVRQGNINDALQAYELAEQYWLNFYGKHHSAAWLEKTPRAQLLIARGSAAQREEGLALARQIATQVAAKLAPSSAQLVALNAMTTSR